MSAYAITTHRMSFIIAFYARKICFLDGTVKYVAILIDDGNLMHIGDALELLHRPHT